MIESVAIETIFAVLAFSHIIAVLQVVTPRTHIGIFAECKQCVVF
jgi:hypothetical protein